MAGTLLTGTALCFAPAFPIPVVAVLIQQGLNTMWWYCGYGFLGSNHQIVSDFFVALVHDHRDH